MLCEFWAWHTLGLTLRLETSRLVIESSKENPVRILHFQNTYSSSCTVAAKKMWVAGSSTLSSSALQNLRVRDVNEPHYDLYIQTGLMDGVVKNDVLWVVVRLLHLLNTSLAISTNSGSSLHSFRLFNEYVTNQDNESLWSKYRTTIIFGTEFPTRNDLRHWI